MNRNYDTVAFDVRENATMLFFAKTNDNGDIDDYVLLMRAINDDFDEQLCIEVNEQQLAGDDMVREVRLTGNVLTLSLRKPAAELDGAKELVLTFDETPQNMANIEVGVFRVLGSWLAGGHA